MNTIKKTATFGLMILIFFISTLLVVALEDYPDAPYLSIQSINENLSIVLTSPVSGANFTNSTSLFNFTLSNATNNVNCTVYGNWSSWSSKTTTSGNGLGNGTHSVNVTNMTGLANGSMYLWAVECIDENNASDSKISNNETFVFVADAIPPPSDTTNPNVTLLSPPDGNSSFNQTQLFIAATTDETALDSCMFYLNNTLNQTNSTPSTNTTFLVTLPVGSHSWNVSCNDTSGNTNTTSAWTITINDTPDTTDPTVSLSSPADDYETGNQNITFVASTNDDIALDSCILYINNTVNQTNSTPAMGGATNFFVPNISEGYYTWNVSCNDTSGNSNVTTSRNFTINMSLVDSTDPITNISKSGTLGENGWYISNVLINFSVVEDDLNRTEYNINGGGWTNFTVPFNLTNEANNTFQYRSVDNSNNVEATQTEYIAIDKSAPSIYSALTSNPTNPRKILDNFSIYTTVNGSVNGTFSITSPSGTETNYVFNKTGNLYYYNFSAVADYGVYEINSSFRDLAGNVLTQTYDVSVIQKNIIQGLNGSENDTISVDNVSTVNVTLDIGLNQSLSNGSINITLYGDSPESSSVTDAVKYYVFEENSDLNDSLDWVVIKLYYEDSEIMGISDGTFDMYWYNESGSSWVKIVDSLDFVNETGRDLSNNYVWANVSHFSTYTFTGIRRDCSDDSAVSQYGCYWGGTLYTSGYICGGSYQTSSCDGGSGGSGDTGNNDASSSSSNNNRRTVWDLNTDDNADSNSYNSTQQEGSGYVANASDPFYAINDTPLLPQDDEVDYSDWDQDENKIKAVVGGVDYDKVWLWTMIVAGVFVLIGFYISHDQVILPKKWRTNSKTKKKK